MLNYKESELLLKHDKQLLNKIAKAKNALERIDIFTAAPVKLMNAKNRDIDFLFINEINKILTTILEISRKPHFSIQGKDLILRSSLINNFSNEHFQQTIRDSSLWKKKEGHVGPEFAYASEHIDNFKIYENIIVKMCFERIELIVERLSVYYKNYISDLKTSFEFDNYSFTSIFNNEEHQLLKKSFFRLHADVNEILQYIQNLERKIQRVRKTYYYEQIRDTRPIRDKLVASNILKFNRKYNQVFHFYLELIKNTNNHNVEEANINYFISVFLNAILGKFKVVKTKQVFEGRKMNLKFLNNQFYLNVVRLRNNVFMFKVKANNKRSISAFSSLTIIDNLDKYSPVKGVTAYEYVLCGKELYRYTTERLIPLKYNYSQGDEGLFNTVLASLTVNIDIDDSLKFNSCPICGQNNINKAKANDLHCLSCNANYALIKYKTNRSFMWIKKVSLEK